jgi:high frequency lysogenization protein
VQNKLDNITIALAGMLQAITLLRELTKSGKINETAFQTCIFSLFQTDPAQIADVFGDLSGVKLGLEKIIKTFDSDQPADPLQNRYLLSLIHLQKKLLRSPKMLNTLTQRIKQTKKQVEYFSLTHPTVIANLADIYLCTISTFKFRIIMRGNQRILSVRENMEKVRALLLAGIRAAVLWRQVGGSRLQLLFSRAKIRASAEKMLAQLESQTKDSL